MSSRDKPIVNEHPSYGMLLFSRTSNGMGTRLFGSALDTHFSTIRMTVSKAQQIREGHEDRYFGMGKEYIEIELSSTQFAEAITAMNVGSGVPCTIRYLNGERIPSPPNVTTEINHAKAQFGDSLQGMAETMQEYRGKIEQLTDKLPAKSKESLRIALDVITQQLTSNIPFILEQFNRASERVVGAAKQEVEAFTLHALRAAGLEALADGRLPKLLGPGDDSIHTEDGNDT